MKIEVMPDMKKYIEEMDGSLRALYFRLDNDGLKEIENTDAVLKLIMERMRKGRLNLVRLSRLVDTHLKKEFFLEKKRVKDAEEGRKAEEEWRKAEEEWKQLGDKENV